MIASLFLVESENSLNKKIHFTGQKRNVSVERKSSVILGRLPAPPENRIPPKEITEFCHVEPKTLKEDF